jgi:DNA repair exonuclease SbcCD nuclease subunit
LQILHIADTHLDRPFVGYAPDAAAVRRREVWRTFERCLKLAVERRVAAITIGGDLWEDEHVTADTRQSVADRLGQLGLDTLIVAGNHDRRHPGGHYDRTDWPSNVTVFEPDEPTRVQLGDEVAVWGVSWGPAELTSRFLDGFSAPADGTAHALLLHGTHRSAGHPAFEEGYCSFSSQQVLDAGFASCLAGHIHAASDDGTVVYPGSPEPLGWGETGRHCAAIVDLAPGRDASIELVDMNAARYETFNVDAARASSSAALRERVQSALASDSDEAVYAKVVLRGEVEPGCLVDAARLATEVDSRFAGLRIEDATTEAYDLDALARESGARGEFVRRIRDRIEQADSDDGRAGAERALYAGLRALDGTRGLVGVG